MIQAATDGSGVRQLDVGMFSRNATYRPPSGAEILFVGSDSPEGTGELFLVNADGTNLRRLAKGGPMVQGIGYVEWSPDGSTVTYSSSSGQRMISADGTSDRSVNPSTDAGWYGGFYSNDGTRVLMLGTAYAGQEVQRLGTIVNVDGGDSVELARLDGVGYLATAGWSPDDGLIIAVADGVMSDGRFVPVHFDPTTGQRRPDPFGGAVGGSVQRVAP